MLTSTTRFQVPRSHLVRYNARKNIQPVPKCGSVPGFKCQMIADIPSWIYIYFLPLVGCTSVILSTTRFSTIDLTKSLVCPIFLKVLSFNWKFYFWLKISYPSNTSVFPFHSVHLCYTYIRVWFIRNLSSSSSFFFCFCEKFLFSFLYVIKRKTRSSRMFSIARIESSRIY